MTGKSILKLMMLVFTEHCLVNTGNFRCFCLTSFSVRVDSWLASKPCVLFCSLPPCHFSLSAVVDADGRIYIRNWQGGILSGGFEKNPKPIFTEGKNQLEIQNLQEDCDHFGM